MKFSLRIGRISRRVLCHRKFNGISYDIKKPVKIRRVVNKNEASGIRTPDNLIKSQVLYRLS